MRCDLPTAEAVSIRKVSRVQNCVQQTLMQDAVRATVREQVRGASLLMAVRCRVNLRWRRAHLRFEV